MLEPEEDEGAEKDTVLPGKEGGGDDTVVFPSFCFIWAERSGLWREGTASHAPTSG